MPLVICLEPVSYTHLDVYKRQSGNRDSFRDIEIYARLKMDELDLPDWKFGWDQMCIRDSSRHSPAIRNVGYTTRKYRRSMLDMYSRISTSRAPTQNTSCLLYTSRCV